MAGLNRIPQSLQEKALEQIRLLSRSEKLESYPTQRVNQDGSVLDIWMTASALLNKAGQMYAIATTERKRDAKKGQMPEAQDEQRQ
jgi:two-component system, chemotaxis family, CheB/CheR fusion protein